MSEIHHIFELPGNSRAPISECQLTTENDLEAVEAWLKEYISVPNTYKAYQKEAQRLLLWCGLNAQKPLSALMRDDFDSYRQFLQNPKIQKS